MRPFFLALALGLAACIPSVDPDKGRFSCTTAEDCGAGWECKPQFAGGGRCFKAGSCGAVELCNGSDDTCDGRVDETFAEQGGACPTGVPGRCAVGARACQAGTVVCVQTVMPTVEVCNGLDDNCNGASDETFDLTQDPANCGQCGSACTTGTSCRASTCRETTCTDGVDNDGDSFIDCADDSCFGLECQLTPPPAGLCGAVPARPDGGADAGQTDGGTDGGLQRGCFRAESVCDDGFDDDGDGQADCLDPDCDARPCFSGTTCTNRLCPGPG